MKLIKHVFGALFIVLFLFSSCKKDVLLTSTSAKLNFSTTEVLFDTVFTQVGSTTRIFRIHNNHNQPINISKIYLGAGNNSQYRINVDGISAKSFSNVEIPANDSLFVFVQVTVNPTSSTSLLLIRDSVVFETNGNVQHVRLTAIGQNVYLHKPDHFPTNGLPPYSIIHCDDIWTSNKPHLIFGYAVVDSGCTLTMQPGTKVYLNNQAVLWVYNSGTLIINGAYGNEVTFQGARLEPIYKEVPGQWGKIWLSAGSKNNVIDWAIIKNGSIGVQADTIGASTSPTLLITNTIIKNMQTAALYGQGSFIRGYDCLFANCGQYAAALTIGGRYSFEQCTFANYWTGSQRTTPLLLLNNHYTDITGATQIRNLDSAYFGNCILYGNLTDEVGLDSSTTGGNFSFKFDYCILATSLNTTSLPHYNKVLSNVDPGFVDPSSNNYQLRQGSVAIDNGNTAIYISPDLNNKPRPNPNTSTPDLGAYEFY